MSSKVCISTRDYEQSAPMLEDVIHVYIYVYVFFLCFLTAQSHHRCLPQDVHRTLKPVVRSDKTHQLPLSACLEVPLESQLR